MADLLAKRFTQTLVTDMATHLASHSFDEKIAELVTQAKLLGDELYNQSFVDHIALMDSLPQGWLDETSLARFKFLDGEEEVKVPLDEYSQDGNYFGQIKTTERKNLTWHMSGNRRMPYTIRYEYLPLQVKSEICQRLIKLNNEIEHLKLERFTFRTKMISYLTNAKSFKGLYATWPEVREVLQEFEPTETVDPMLPAAPLEEYNKLLGIPTEKTITATA
ncbi:Nmad5 family putative nucleotide modification protein [Acinetobacter nosocomialis]|uniref:Nmad5 family putative nucleotide modification protein n=1 Tax=Acinetobacter nosocomialis TaxID=106654 RepID=UPI0033AC0B8C